MKLPDPLLQGMAAAVASPNVGFGSSLGGAFRRLSDESSSGAASSTSAASRLSRPSLAKDHNVGGVGIVFSKDQAGLFTVRTLQEGSCAAASGMRPGDIIVSVDGVKTEGLTMRQVAAAISGAVGSPVMLMIRRGNQSGNVTLERMPGLSKGVVGKEQPVTPGQSLPLSSPPASAADDAPRSYIADELSARSRDSEVIAAVRTPPLSKLLSPPLLSTCRRGQTSPSHRSWTMSQKSRIVSGCPKISSALISFWN